MNLHACKAELSDYRANARIHKHFCPILWAWLTAGEPSPRTNTEFPTTTPTPEILFAARLTSPIEAASQT